LIETLILFSFYRLEQRIWRQVANILVGILVVVALVSLIQAVTVHEVEEKIVNWMTVALILLVIT
jgi:hypothetical protein